jgi:hypothetical protein
VLGAQDVPDRTIPWSSGVEEQGADASVAIVGGTTSHRHGDVLALRC